MSLYVSAVHLCALGNVGTAHVCDLPILSSAVLRCYFSGNQDGEASHVFGPFVTERCIKVPFSHYGSIFNKILKKVSHRDGFSFPTIPNPF